jgi:hypothetical protein
MSVEAKDPNEDEEPEIDPELLRELEAMAGKVNGDLAHHGNPANAPPCGPTAHDSRGMRHQLRDTTIVMHPCGASITLTACDCGGQFWRVQAGGAPCKSDHLPPEGLRALLTPMDALHMSLLAFYQAEPLPVADRVPMGGWS